MSLTLKIATATTIVLTKAKTLANGVLFQLIGTSYLLTTKYRLTQNIGKTGTAKTRVVIELPYSYVDTDGLTKYDSGYFSIEATVPRTMPVSEAGKGAWLVQSAAADASFNDAVANRAITLS